MKSCEHPDISGEVATIISRAPKFRDLLKNRENATNPRHREPCIFAGAEWGDRRPHKRKDPARRLHRPPCRGASECECGFGLLCHIACRKYLTGEIRYRNEN